MKKFYRSRISGHRRLNYQSTMDKTLFGIPRSRCTHYGNLPDNKSRILLADNGKSSSSRRTKHLDVCYFFVTDKIKKGEVKVAFCPTHNMRAEFFTKPLQGSMFVPMRENSLNLPICESTEVHRSVLDNEKT